MQQHRPYSHMKVARYSFSGSIAAKFEHKLRRHKQTFGKIATTVVLDKDQGHPTTEFSKYARSASDEFLYALEAYLVNLELP